MGKIECTKISGHFVQFALWFENGRFHWTLIRPRKKDCFFYSELPHLAQKGRCLPSMSNYPLLPSKATEESQIGLSGAGFARSEVPDIIWIAFACGRNQQGNLQCSGRWRSSKQKRLGECPPPQKKVSPDLVSRPHPFVACISLSKQQLLQKIPLKREGFLFFTLARRLLLLENKKNLHLNPDDIATGTLFTVWQKPVPFLQPH